ncbi:pilus assembly protein PilM [Pantoea sp. Ap-967]|uniref:type IV pilus biogenesis protein PilM n=1 Tax=Pantoea sp. Ap-967 TaxID=2608362 RepID=UPI00141E9AD2|nr:pilus assembly protein PilM [Pantoea sp. Ap-967]NIE76078.1 pilus assembly protein PilM [Pantoea sp. Ap-967]
MLGRFGKDAGSLLGVEIAADSVRVAQLRRRAGRLERVAWAFQGFEPFAPGNARHDDERVAGALRSAYRQCGSRQRRAAVALPASQVICKVLQLPAGQADSERETQLLADADQLFPFPLEELQLDFQVLGASQLQPGYLDVMVAACRQSLLQPLESLFAQARLELAVVEVDSIALQRLMPPQAGGRAALLRIEPGSLIVHGWQQGSLPRQCELQAGVAPQRSGDVFADGVAPTEVFVTGAPALGQGGLARLGEALGLSCTPLPLLAALDCSDSRMALASALALGGMH